MAEACEKSLMSQKQGNRLKTVPRDRIARSQLAFIVGGDAQQAAKKSLKIDGHQLNMDSAKAFKDPLASLRNCPTGFCVCRKIRAQLRPGIPEIEPPG
jgi:hypothetical protein